MNKTVWKESSGALRRLLSSVDMPGQSYNSRRRYHLDALYKFGRFFDDRTRQHFIWNHKSQNIIAVVRVRDDKVYIRYRKNSVYAPILASYNYPITTVHMTSGNLARKRRIVRECISGNVQHEFQRWRNDRQAQNEPLPDNIERIVVPYHADMGVAMAYISEIAKNNGYSDERYHYQLHDQYMSTINRTTHDPRNPRVFLYLDKQYSDDNIKTIREAEEQQQEIMNRLMEQQVARFRGMPMEIPEGYELAYNPNIMQTEIRYHGVDMGSTVSATHALTDEDMQRAVETLRNQEVPQPRDPWHMSRFDQYFYDEEPQEAVERSDSATED